MAKQDSKWSTLFENIIDLTSFIQYSVQHQNYTFEISIENKALFSFELDLGYKKKQLNLMIEPKEKETKETLEAYAVILRNLTKEIDSGYLPEPMKNITNRIKQMENIPPTLHRIFKLKEGDWRYENTEFIDFPNAKGEFNLSYPANIKWQLLMKGCWQDTVATESNCHQNLRLKLTGEKELFSPDAKGIKFRAGIKESIYYYADLSNYYIFSDVVELSPGKYNIQLQISIIRMRFHIKPI